MVVVFITSLKEDNTNNFYFYIAIISYISVAIFYNVANAIDNTIVLLSQSLF